MDLSLNSDGSASKCGHGSAEITSNSNAVLDLTHASNPSDDTTSTTADLSSKTSLHVYSQGDLTSFSSQGNNDVPDLSSVLPGMSLNNSSLLSSMANYMAMGFPHMFPGASLLTNPMLSSSLPFLSGANLGLPAQSSSFGSGDTNLVEQIKFLNSLISSQSLAVYQKQLQKHLEDAIKQQQLQLEMLQQSLSQGPSVSSVASNSAFKPASPSTKRPCANQDTSDDSPIKRPKGRPPKHRPLSVVHSGDKPQTEDDTLPKLNSNSLQKRIRKGSRSFDIDAIELPLKIGWQRQTRIREFGEKGVMGEVLYYTPCGKKLRTYPEVFSYLAENQISNLTQKNFSFSTKIAVGEVLQICRGQGWKAITHSELEEKLASVSKQCIIGVRSKKDLAVDPVKDSEKSVGNAELCDIHNGSPTINESYTDTEFSVTATCSKKEIVKQDFQPSSTSLSSSIQATPPWQEHVMLLREQEQKHQRALYLKAIESQRRQQEREEKSKLRLAQQKRRRELILQQQYKSALERQQRIQVQLQLPPVKPLPKLDAIPNLVVNGRCFADCLMIYEFLQNFRGTIGFATADLLSIDELQKAVIGADQQCVDKLRAVIMRLLKFALHDASIADSCRNLHSVLGIRVTEMRIATDNYSEVLRLVLTARAGEKSHLVVLLNSFTFEGLPAEAKAEIMAFLCDELVTTEALCRHIDATLDEVADLKRERWKVECELREAKLNQVLANKRPTEEDKPVVVPVVDELKDSTDLGLGSLNESLGAIKNGDDTRGTANSDTDTVNGPEPAKTAETSKCDILAADAEVESDKVRRLSQLQDDYRRKVLETSQRLRGVHLGRDRYSRRYWLLRHAGGIYVESPYSGSFKERQNGIQMYTKNLSKEHVGVCSKTAEVSTPNCVVEQKPSQQSPSSDPVKTCAARDEEKSEISTAKPARSSREDNLSRENCSHDAVCSSQTESLLDLPLDLSMPHDSARPVTSSSPSTDALTFPTEATVAGNASHITHSIDKPNHSTCENEHRHGIEESSKGSENESNDNRRTWYLIDNSKVTSEIIRNLDLHDMHERIFYKNLLKFQSFASEECKTTSEAGICALSTTLQVNDFPDLEIKVVQSLLSQIKDLESRVLLANLQSAHWLDDNKGTRISSPKNANARLDCIETLSQLGPDETDLAVTESVPSVDISLNISDNLTEETGGQDKEPETPITTCPSQADNGALSANDTCEVESSREQTCTLSQSEPKCAETCLSITRLFSQAKQRLRELELHIERRYLNPPLNDMLNKILATVPISRSTASLNRSPARASTPLSTTSYDDIPSVASSGTGLLENVSSEPVLCNGESFPKMDCSKSPDSSDNEMTIQVATEDRGECLPKGVTLWRNAVASATNCAQLKMCLTQLSDCIAWEKSIMKVICEICRGSDNDAELLLCDACDKGYHTYCFKPRMELIPTGDWYCYECMSRATGHHYCIICGQKCYKAAQCHYCQRSFHAHCLSPPLLRVPRKWSCHGCSVVAQSSDNDSRKKTKLSSNLSSHCSSTQNRRSSYSKNSQSSIYRKMLDELVEQEDSWPFLEPVDINRVPLYGEIIKQPMDFSTMRIKLESKMYKSDSEFVADARLVFANCATFNQDRSKIGRAGKRISKFFEKRWTDLTACT